MKGQSHSTDYSHWSISSEQVQSPSLTSSSWNVPPTPQRESGPDTTYLCFLPAHKGHPRSPLQRPATPRSAAGVCVCVCVCVCVPLGLRL